MFDKKRPQAILPKGPVVRSEPIDIPPPRVERRILPKPEKVISEESNHLLTIEECNNRLQSEITRLKKLNQELIEAIEGQMNINMLNDERIAHLEGELRECIKHYTAEHNWHTEEGVSPVDPVDHVMDLFSDDVNKVFSNSEDLENDQDMDKKIDELMARQVYKEEFEHLDFLE